MKKIVVFLISFLVLFNSSVKANSIDSINMDIYIDKFGDAHIKETWNTYLNEGTEGYKPYYNLGNATITDFSVKKDGNLYQTISDWNINGTLSSKAYKAGINYISDGLELCFGISSYGSSKYELNYKIKGFVTKTSDAQMVYWTLIPNKLNPTPKKVYIKIYADELFSQELPVYGYGNYGGLAYVYDGYIEMSNDDLQSEDYMTILVEFTSGTFNTSNILEESIEYYKELANEGSTAYNEKNNIFATIIGIIVSIFSSIFWIIFIVAIVSHASKNQFKSGSISLRFGKTTNKLPKEVNMFRELPSGKDIYRAYFLASNYGLMKKKTDFLGVILLKWLKEGKITTEKRTVGMVFKKEDTTIIFKEKPTNSVELELYNYMIEASKDLILESKEFEKWCSSNYKDILKWFDNILDYQNEILIKEGKLVKKEEVNFKIFKTQILEVDPSLYEEATRMKGLKLFFNEMKNMKDKNAIDVMLWEEYLMYAQMFGVADKVAKEFKELYPELIDSENNYNYTNIMFLNNIAYSGMTSASSARSRAESYSAGGGGFSSGGGGGGSFGGGGGGGGFR